MLKIAVFCLVVVGCPATVGATTLADLADVHWDGKRIVASPGNLPDIGGESVSLVKSENCPHHVDSKSSVEVPGACQYLGGIYRYHYQPANEAQHEVAVGFALERGGPAGHALVVSMPLDLVHSVSR